VPQKRAGDGEAVARSHRQHTTAAFLALGNGSNGFRQSPLTSFFFGEGWGTPLPPLPLASLRVLESQAFGAEMDRVGHQESPVLPLVPCCTRAAEPCHLGCEFEVVEYAAWKQVNRMKSCSAQIQRFEGALTP
jgi:hypothetical protein